MRQENTAQMNVTITCRHADSNEAIRERIESKADKLARYFDRIHEVEVVLDQQKHLVKAEVVLHCDGVKVKSEETNEEILTAIDRAFAKVERQIKRYKKRLIDSRRRPAKRAIRATETVHPSDLGESEMDMPPEKIGEQVIDTEHRELLSMSAEDAAMHLDLSGDSFFVFLNERNHRVNVIYTRPDAHLGLIEPIIE